MNTKNQKPLGWYVETIKENYDWCSFDTVVKMFQTDYSMDYNYKMVRKAYKELVVNEGW